VQPASLDLRLGHIAYRVRASFLTGKGRTLTDRLPEFEMHRMSLEDGAVLEKGCVYVVPLMERLDLPADISAVANAKSSTGPRRLPDAGHHRRRDGVRPHRAGLYRPAFRRDLPALLLRARETGAAAQPDPLSPGRGRPVGRGAFGAPRQSPLVAGTEGALIDEGLGFSVDLTPGPGGLVGYRAKPHTGVIDLTRIGAHEVADFWEELRPEGPEGAAT
jgi:dCTP deaminase